MSPMSAEATVVRNYLDWLLDIPWKKRNRVKYDIGHAQTVLDEDHFGLEKVKDVSWNIWLYSSVRKVTRLYFVSGWPSWCR